MGNEYMTYFSISSKILVEEAKNLGFEVEILNPNKNYYVIRGNGKEVFFKSNDFGGNSSLGYKLAKDKELTNMLLDKKGFKVPRSIYLDRNDLHSFKLEDTNLRFPLVTKPIDEGHGNGVTVNIENEEELKKGLEYAFSFGGDRTIIQEYILGDDHRVLVIGDKVVYCIKKIPAFIVGDGEKTIKELIEIENKNPLRGKGYEKPLSFIEIDERLISYIKKSNLTIESIPKKGEYIRLRGVSNIGAGGVGINKSDEINDKLKDYCVNIAKSMGLVVAGIDMITLNLSKSLEETGGAIIELGADPGFGGDYELTGINPGLELLKYVFGIKDEK